MNRNFKCESCGHCFNIEISGCVLCNSRKIICPVCNSKKLSINCSNCGKMISENDHSIFWCANCWDFVCKNCAINIAYPSQTCDHCKKEKIEEKNLPENRMSKAI